MGIYEKRENNLKYAAADFMNRKYPGLVWDMKWDHVEFKNKRKAAEIKRISCVNCDWPDFVLLSPNYHHKGLVVEFKDCKDTVFKKNGQMRENKHLLAQTKTLNRLIKLGYCAKLCWDIDDFMDLIDNYVGDYFLNGIYL